MPKMKTEQVSIDSVNVDERIYPRVGGVNWRTVANYKMAMRVGTRFPPIVLAEVEGKANVLIDGRHRLEAAKAIGALSIEMQNLGALSVPEARMTAAERNSKHGRPLTYADRLDVYSKLTADGIQIEKIASVLSVPVKEIVRFAAHVARPMSPVGGPREAAEIRIAQRLLALLRGGEYEKTPAFIGVLHELREEIAHTVTA